MNVSPKLTAHTEKQTNLTDLSVVFTKVLKKCITSRCHSSAMTPVKLAYMWNWLILHVTVSVFFRTCEDHCKDQTRIGRLFELTRIANDTESNDVR